MEENFSWIYLLIFLIIPLARILPRIFKRGDLKKSISARLESPRENFIKESDSANNFEEIPSREELPTKEEFSTKDWPKEKIVLGLLMTSISKFEDLQKRGNLSTNNLDRILQNLEKNGFMTPVEKSGPFGKSVQLKITEKGAREFRRM